MVITNNTEIKIRNTRTGKITTILKTAPIAQDRVTGKVVAGIPFIDTVDDSLDSFVVQLKDLKQRDLFKPFDFVVFTVDDGIQIDEKKYFVLFDDVQTYSQERKTYVHNLSLIEPTKILEKTKIFNLNLTNKSNTLYEQIFRAVRNAEPVFYNASKDGKSLYKNESRFFPSTALYLLTNKIESRDFYFANTDLRSVLDEMLSVCNVRVAVEDVAYYKETDNISTITFGYRDKTKVESKTPIWTKEEQGELIFEHAENDGQNYAGTIVARGYNSLTEEPITFSDMFKSNEADVSDANVQAFFPFPISEKGIKSFSVRLIAFYNHLSADGSSNKSFAQYIMADISKAIVPEEQYNLLSKSEKKYYIPYQKGGKTLFLGGTHNTWIGTSELSIYYAANKALQGTKYPGFIDEDGTEYLEGEFIEISLAQLEDYYKYPFVATYYPIIDTVSSVSKPNIYDKDELLMGIMDSQTEQTLDIYRHGKKLAGLIKRTGNAEYYLDVKAKYYSKLLPLMSKIDLPDADSDEEKGYVLYKREYSIFDNFINCRYYFSKDFNAIQQNAGVNREKHLFDIPLESSETPIVVKKYLVFSTAPGDGGGFETSLPIAAANTLIGKNESKSYNVANTDTEIMAGGKLKYLLFNAHGKKTENGKENIYPQNTENGSDKCNYTDPSYRFVRPVCSYVVNKTMTFTANCLDNYSVDYSRDGYSFSIWGDAGHRITYNRYVDKTIDTVGEARKFELDFAFEWIYAGKETSVEAIESLKLFPVAKNTDFVTCGLSDAPLTVEYFKDRTQTPLFVFALECVPSEADYGKIIVGTEFARKNNLVRDNGEELKELYLYISRKITFNGDEEFLSTEYMSETGALTLTDGSWFSVEEYRGSSGSGALLKHKGTYDGVSWAIADKKGNIYLAVNGEMCDIYVSVANFPYKK